MTVGDVRHDSLVSPATPVKASWQRSYASRLVVTDTAVVAAVTLGSQLAWFGPRPTRLEWGLDSSLSYSLVSAALVIAWMISLHAHATRDHRVIGSGNLEYKRVADATLRVFGLFAIGAFLFSVELAQGYILTALPAGLVLLVLSRWWWRQWLRARQRRGAYLSRAILVGERTKSAHAANMIRRSQGTGLQLVGAFTRGGDTGTPVLDGIPVMGRFADVLETIDNDAIEAVIVTGADDISPADLRQLGWDLQARDVELIVAPALTDVAGPRIHARPLAGIPLIHVSYPTFEGMQRFYKRLFDIVGSLTLIILIAPVLVAVAVAVKATSPGGIIYRQERIGWHGRPFGMLKFRSMVRDADDQLESLLDAQGTSDKPLFKVTDDPRITPVGRFIRRTSLDELPQLFNVLFGQMSLVGPRPQRAAEVALYDDAAHRRHLMKPGMSGLWQVSGRSNLSWDDAIRLDLYYVENWSMTGDVQILFKTIRAITTSDGAV